jgi:hypothetical protein
MKMILLATAAVIVVATSAQAQQPQLPKACFEQYDASDVQFCNEAKKRLGLDRKPNCVGDYIEMAIDKANRAANLPNRTWESLSDQQRDALKKSAEAECKKPEIAAGVAELAKQFHRKAELAKPVDPNDREVIAEMPVMCTGPQPTVSEKFRQNDPKTAEILDRGDERRRKANQPFCDQQQAAATARVQARRKAELEQIERLEEASRRQAEQQKIAAEKARQQQIEMAKPVNQLRLAYYRYSYIRSCYKIRLGYLAVWINDVELQRAKDAVTTRERMVLEQDSTINTDTEWSNVQAKMPQWYYENECRQYYNALITSIPRVPGKKDFGS